MRRKIVALLCGSLMVAALSGTGENMVGAASKTTIASLDYSYSDLHDTDTEAKYINSKDPKNVIAGGKISLDLADKYGSKSTGYQFTHGSGLLFASLNAQDRRKLEWSGDEDKFQDGNAEVYAPVITAGKKNMWDIKNLPYFEIQFSTKGYEDISFSAAIGATKKGPKSYKMAYRTGSSGAYSDLSDSSASVTLAKNKQFTEIRATLPDAAKNKDTVMVKIYATTASTVGGGTLTDDPTGGKIGINHISVQGSAVKAAATKAPEKTPAPTQSQSQQDKKEEKKEETSAAGQNTDQEEGKNQNKNEKQNKTKKIGKASLSAASLKKKEVTVSIKRVSGATGYHVQAAANRKMTKKVKSVYTTGTKAVLRQWKGKKCYVRVRAYQTKTSGKSSYGKWSSVKKVS